MHDKPRPVGRMVMYDDETHLGTPDGIIRVGDTFDVFRGSGPREGDRIGVATVTAIEATAIPSSSSSPRTRRGRS
jgi:hypothetical protein